MRTYRDAKAMAKTLRDVLAVKKVSVSHSECLEIVAQQFGFPNWNTLSSKLSHEGHRPESSIDQDAALRLTGAASHVTSPTVGRLPAIMRCGRNLHRGMYCVGLRRFALGAAQDRYRPKPANRQTSAFPRPDRANAGRPHASAAPRFVLLRGVAGLSGFPGGQRMDVGSFQRLAADRPVTTFELIDANPGDAAHILAFDLDHRRSNLSDEVLLLLGGENVPNHIDRNERHVISPSDLNTAAGTTPPLVIEVEHAPDAHA
jgi:hypothetical protein